MWRLKGLSWKKKLKNIKKVRSWTKASNVGFVAASAPAGSALKIWVLRLVRTAENVAFSNLRVIWCSCSYDPPQCTSRSAAMRKQEIVTFTLLIERYNIPRAVLHFFEPFHPPWPVVYLLIRATLDADHKVEDRSPFLFSFVPLPVTSRFFSSFFIILIYFTFIWYFRPYKTRKLYLTLQKKMAKKPIAFFFVCPWAGKQGR